MKANNKSIELVRKKYSEMVQSVQLNPALRETLQPQALQLAECHKSLETDLKDSIEQYQKIQQQVKLLQELYTKLKLAQRQATTTQPHHQHVSLPASTPPDPIFTCTFPPANDASSNNTRHTSEESKQASPTRRHRRSRSETPVTELAKMRLEQAKTMGLVATTQPNSKPPPKPLTTSASEMSLNQPLSITNGARLTPVFNPHQNQIVQQASPNVFDAVPGFSSPWSSMSPQKVSNENNTGFADAFTSNHSYVATRSTGDNPVDMFGASPF